MAMHEVFLEKGKAQPQINSVSEANEEKPGVDEKINTATETSKATPLDTLKEHVASFNQVREAAGLDDMFVGATFHREVIEKLLSQPDTHGLRLYLSKNKDTGSFEPIIVAVNNVSEDIISNDDTLHKTFFCTADSKCPPPPSPGHKCSDTFLLL